MDRYAAALPGLPRLGARRIRALVEHFGTAERLWKCTAEELAAARLLPERLAGEFLDYRRKTDPADVEAELRKRDIHVATWRDETYPPLLKETANPPAVLFYRGEAPVWSRTVAIVGARKATAYGVNAASHLAEALAKEGVTVISGGARGVDTASHTGCLSGGAPTAAVLACGLDVTYPPENRNLFRRICEAGGAILSEYPLGTPPLGRQFPARNRIIAGMCRAVVVTEAAERSGSLITADFALEEGRDVFAVPGSIWSPMSRGTHKLIRNGAICCTGAEDILSEYGWGAPAEEEKSPARQLTLEEEMVYRFCCMGETVSAESLLAQSGLSMTKLTMILLSLTMKGYITEEGPGRYAAGRTGETV